MKQLAEQGSQFIISTHSPIIMSYPDAEIYEITDRGLEPTELEETSHFRLMKRFILDRRGILRQMSWRRNSPRTEFEGYSLFGVRTGHSIG